ncbi:LAME_0G19834g1_1 [Lachancea meyersii CBS 8951]|uniref:LAME_0G19834g1_1 n=1 Tax=Lachancea meyersii CBS 8951 TaxID=1266667 RepID=A0A1G4KC84_9SACH|nr:LAME_0G19834g1_1 [Lachancea meyersii CBS 8951]
MSKYAWYTRVTDAAHRLTVLTLVGGTIYMAGGLVYTMHKTGTKYEQQVTQKAAEAEAEKIQ